MNNIRLTNTQQVQETVTGATIREMKMRHILFLSIFAFLSAVASSAKEKVYHLGFEMSKTGFCDTIPIIVDEGQIYIDIELGGEKRRFNLDTGAAQGALFGNAAMKGARHLGYVASNDAAGNKDTVEVVALPTLTFSSGLKTEGYVATVYDKGSVKRKYDGVLGFDLFNSGISAKIDTRAGVMILSDRTDIFAKEKGHRLKYRLKWFAPYVKVSPFIRHVDEALFDTGYRHLYTMNDESFRKHSYKSRQVMEQVTDSAKGSFAIGNIGAEESAMVYFMQLDRLAWGEYRFTDVSAMTTRGSSKIGAALLNYGSIIIEPKRKSLTFQPYCDTDSTSVTNTLPSLAFVPVNGKPAIGIVARGCDAYKAGARSGDIILSIDGKPMLTFADLLAYPFIYDRENIFLLQSANGQIKEVRMKRRLPVP